MNWLTFRELCVKLNLKSSVMYRVIYEPDFPKARSVTGSSKGKRWRSDEVDAWLDLKTVGDAGDVRVNVA